MVMIIQPLLVNQVTMHIMMRAVEGPHIKVGRLTYGRAFKMHSLGGV